MKINSHTARLFCALTVLLSATVITFAQQSFQVTSFATTGAVIFQNHNPYSGDDRGGIALSSSSIFYNGDMSVARFNRSDLGDPMPITPQRTIDTMVSNLRTKQVYALADDFGVLGNGGGLVTRLIELDPVNGSVTANVITLSSSIFVGNGMKLGGIFAGWDRIVLMDGFDNHAYNIDLPSGNVSDLGEISIPNDWDPNGRMGCENWATWGVAEYTAGSVQLLYASQPMLGFARSGDFGGGAQILRYDVKTGNITTAHTFDGEVADLCSFTVDPSLNRWYFHFEYYSPAFGLGGDENIGYADATFLAPSSATATLTGRVFQGKEGPIAGAVVTLQKPDGSSVSARTNSMGNYVISKLITGQSYVVTVAARRHTFDTTSQLVQMNGDISGFNFEAN